PRPPLSRRAREARGQDPAVRGTLGAWPSRNGGFGVLTGGQSSISAPRRRGLRPLTGRGLDDVDLEPLVRRSQCVLDLRGRLAAGKQEAEVAIALRQGPDGTAVADRDLEPGDAGHGARVVLAAHLPQYARARDRKHHHARRRRLAAEVAERQPERVAQDHLLEAHTDAEAKRARAQPSDRARGELEHTHAL